MSANLCTVTLSFSELREWNDWKVEERGKISSKCNSVKAFIKQNLLGRVGLLLQKACMIQVGVHLDLFMFNRVFLTEFSEKSEVPSLLRVRC